MGNLYEERRYVIYGRQFCCGPRDFRVIPKKGTKIIITLYKFGRKLYKCIA